MVSAWFLVQVVIDVVFLCGLVIQARKMMRAPKDDPRLSRGLQLLQSKISILEDLSDRTEIQVKQLSALLDQKTRDVQERIYEAEHHVQLIRKSMAQSLEVAEIFQDKIPHQEIIERQNTKKYIYAAQLAHEGKTVEEIAALIDLPREELVLIAKINREHLVFEEDQLPAWANPKRTAPAEKPALFEPGERLPAMTLEMLGDEFRRAHPPLPTAHGASPHETSTLVNRFATTKIFQKAAQMLESGGGEPNGPDSAAKFPIDAVPSAAEAGRHPFEFKKIDLSDTLG